MHSKQRSCKSNRLHYEMKQHLEHLVSAPSVHLLTSLCNWFTSCLRYGKQWGYPDYRRFLPPLFTAMPGITALFTQARSGKLWIPHPHGTCIMGYRGQGFLGEFSLTQTWKNVMFNKQHRAVKQSDLDEWHFVALCFGRSRVVDERVDKTKHWTWLIKWWTWTIWVYK